MDPVGLRLDPRPGQGLSAFATKGCTGMRLAIHQDEPSTPAATPMSLAAWPQACQTPKPASRRPMASSTSISRAASYGIGL